MNAITSPNVFRASDMLATFTPAQLNLIRQTDAKDCNDAEFNQYIEVSKALGLSPLRKQISAIVFNKNKPDKRNMAIIVRIDGFRAIANRSGDYRPMDTAPIFDIDEALKSPTNPHGIVRCEVRCWKQYGAEWFPIVGEAYWDEFAPLEKEWGEGPDGRRAPTGKETLSATWAKMPRLMIAKVAESQALRRGWPEQLSGVYSDEEMERAIVIDGTATEIVAQHQEGQRQARLGGANAVMLLVEPGEPAERVERGAIADRLHYIYRTARTADEIIQFRVTNAEALKQFWVWEPGDALAVKKYGEDRIIALSEIPADA